MMEHCGTRQRCWSHKTVTALQAPEPCASARLDFSISPHQKTKTIIQTHKRQHSAIYDSTFTRHLTWSNSETEAEGCLLGGRVLGKGEWRGRRFCWGGESSGDGDGDGCRTAHMHRWLEG